MKPSVRKAFAALGGLAVGVLGAVALSSPAQAHHTTVTATTECADGSWTVHWTVENWNTNLPATIDALDASVDSPITGELAVGATLAGQPYSKLTGSQVIPAETTEARLQVSATWENGQKQTNKSDTVTIDASACAAPPGEPVVEAAHSCEGVSVTVSNPEDGIDTAVTLTPTAGEATTVQLAPGDSQTVEFPLPADTEEFSVEVGGDVPAQTIAWENPGNCAPATMDVVADCDGLYFTVTNPQDGSTVEVTFTPTTGEARTVTVEPGNLSEVHFVPEGDDYAVSVASGDYTETIDWAAPEDCDTDAAPQLPTTGSSTTMWIVSGAVALIAGAGLFVMIRRRKAATTW